jgi:nickel-dependent lactate racemase
MELRTADGTVAISEFVADALGPARLDGRSLCVIVPDATRTCPVPELLEAIRDAVIDRVSRLTVLIALGTHQPIKGDALIAHIGKGIADDPRITVVNHEWWDPEQLTTLGAIDPAEIARESEGRLTESVAVTINRNAVEHDVCLVVGPVFPHEVIGFSGGNKYFFPGISGPEVINLTHWLGALITSGAIIGVPGITPVRRIVNRAAEMVPTERLCLALVVPSGTNIPAFMAFGTPEEAWAAAADVSAQTHIRYLDKPVRRVLSLVSERYDDLWTAAKGMYKVDPVVADGGEVVLYAPHVRTASVTHGEFIERIGYHCRDYFLANMERFSDVPRGVIAHSTHVRGAGTFDPVNGEQCRITVSLATGIDRATTEGALGLSYRDPGTIDSIQDDPETFVVPNAGEVLYRLN